MNVQNHSLGVRIKYYRQQNGLTQKQLGEAVGVVESAIRNYELGKRTPDIPTLQNIALELGVDFYTLYNPYHFDPSASIHALFQMQALYGLEPAEVDGEIILKISKKESELQSYLEYWYNALKSLKENRISEQDYNDWMDAFPTFSEADETGLPIWGKDVVKSKKPTEDDFERDYKVYTVANSWAGRKDFMSFKEYKEFRLRSDNK